MVSEISREVKRQQAEKAAALGESKMRVSKRQLRRIIREEKRKILREQSWAMPDDSDPLDDPGTQMTSRPGKTKQTYWPEHDKSHEYKGASGKSFSKGALDDMQQAIDYFRDRGSEADAVDLEGLLAMASKELASGAEYPSEELFNRAYYETDTVVREEIPHEIYEWLSSWDDTRDVE